MVKFKFKKDFNRFLSLNPVALVVLFDMNFFCKLNNMPFKITSTVSTLSEDEALERVSTTHLEGRAFDISVHGWTEKQIENFKYHFERKFAMYSAKNKDGEDRLIVRHVGTADHLHVQIHPRYNKFRDSDVNDIFWEVDHE